MKYSNRGNEEAKARLRAAAPDLLEAIKDLLVEAQDYVLADGGDPSPAMKTAAEVIKRAEGGKP